jgi:hypothetical protein
MGQQVKMPTSQRVKMSMGQQALPASSRHVHPGIKRSKIVGRTRNSQIKGSQHNMHQEHCCRGLVRNQ